MLISPPIGFANDTSFIDFFKSRSHIDTSEVFGVVIPHYNRLEELKITLGALSAQSYPSKYLEVVIADDGSSCDFSELISGFSNIFFSLTLVRQEDNGFRLSRIRNLGIDALKHSTKLLILDCDIVPSKSMIMRHFEVLNVSSNVVSIGFRQDNSTVRDLSDILKGEPPFEALDWRLKHIQKGPEFTHLSNTVWLLCSGGNVAFHKSLHTAERFDESFTFWGGEDNEWAYRLLKRGCYFYFNTDARAFHANITPITYDKTNHKNLSISHTRKKCPSLDEISQSLSDWEVPLITFWITNFNKAPYLLKALQSLNGCNYSHEILVVDNNSSDNSLEMLSNLNFIRLVSEPKQGAYYAYERALLEAKGEFLIQLDADDTLDISFVNSQIAFLLEQPFGLLYGLVQPCDHNLDPIPNAPIWNTSAITRSECILSGMYIRCPRILRKRDLARSPKRPYMSSAVDFNLYSKVLFTTYSKCVEAIAYQYRKTPHSITETDLVNQKANTLKVIDHNRSLLHNSELLFETERAARNVVYQENNAMCYFLDHLGLSSNALSVFNNNPDPLTLIDETLCAQFEISKKS